MATIYRMNAVMSITGEARKRMVKMIMIQRGISVNDMADMLGVTPGFVSLLVAGKRRSRKQEEKLCRVLGIKRDLLWN